MVKLFINTCNEDEQACSKKFQNSKTKSEKH